MNAYWKGVVDACSPVQINSLHATGGATRLTVQACRCFFALAMFSLSTVRKIVVTCLSAVIYSMAISTLQAGSNAAKEVAPPLVEPETAPLLTGILTVAWDSDLIWEGRNFVEEGGLPSTFLMVNTPSGFGGWFWFADSSETDFAEWDVALQYGRKIGDLDLGAGGYYGHNYRYDDNFTVAYAWASYLKYSWLIPGAKWKYGDFAGGSYLELSLASEYKFLRDKLLISPSTILGIDFGYATEDVDGYNNVQLMLAATYLLSDTLSVKGYVAQSFGMEDIEASGDDDQTWWGVSLTVAF